jgi:hypothetical protein
MKTKIESLNFEILEKLLIHFLFEALESRAPKHMWARAVGI